MGTRAIYGSEDGDSALFPKYGANDLTQYIVTKLNIYIYIYYVKRKIYTYIYIYIRYMYDYVLAYFVC